MTQEPELTDAELERESAEALPEREAMSTLNPDPSIVDLELEPNPPPWMTPDRPDDQVDY
jgi:hypothetical protein